MSLNFIGKWLRILRLELFMVSVAKNFLNSLGLVKKMLLLIRKSIWIVLKALGRLLKELWRLLNGGVGSKTGLEEYIRYLWK